MDYTEKQAKEKWCPFAGEQRVQRQTELCEASECMAWRFSDYKTSETEGIVWHGYCGLAGRL